MDHVRIVEGGLSRDCNATELGDYALTRLCLVKVFFMEPPPPGYTHPTHVYYSTGGKNLVAVTSYGLISSFTGMGISSSHEPELTLNPYLNPLSLTSACIGFSTTMPSHSS